MNAKQIIWDHLANEIKKVRDYLVELEDERELATTCLANVSIIQESLGDKPLQALNAINYLNTRTKAQLIFAGILDILEIISQARKYVIKDFMMKDIISKDNFMLGRVSYFILLFKYVFQRGFPNFWNEQRLYLSKYEYHIKLLEKINDTSKVDQIVANIKGQDIFDVLDKYLFLFHETRQIIFDFPPLTYKFYF